jgi:protein-S-isoprenylcysteine O-methyltransferase Ste14
LGRVARGVVAATAQLVLMVAAVEIGFALGATHWTFAVFTALAAGALVVGLEAGAQCADDRLPVALADRWLARATALGVAFALIGAPFEIAWRGQGSAWPFAIVLLGALLRAGAISTLGRAFISEAVAPPRLNVNGVYARVRHPSEAGLLLVSAGCALAAPGWACAAGFVAVAVTSAWRIRREDRALAHAFGALHRAYVGRVPALLPRL